jgi:hypothetical protein
MSDPDEDDLDDCYEVEDDSDAELICGALPEGGCSMVGTEWCDWSCPFSDEIMRRIKSKRGQHYVPGRGKQ